MKAFYAIFFFLILILQVGNTNLQVKQTLASTNQQSTQFQSYYYANETSFGYFDVQNVNLFDQQDLYVCFIESGAINYNNFSFTSLQNQGRLAKDNFQILNLNATYLNSSTTLKSCQYYATGDINIFVVCLEYLNYPYSYIFLEDAVTKNIVTTKSMGIAAYFLSNKLFQFPDSNDVYIEMRTEQSFFILKVDILTKTISTEFQRDIITSNDSFFDISDTQFFNDTFYFLVNQVTNTQSKSIVNTTIYLVSSMQPQLKISTIVVEKYLSSANNNVLSEIPITMNKNFTSVRFITENEYILRDGDNNFYQGYLLTTGGAQNLELNDTLFSLQKVSSDKAEYTLEGAKVSGTSMYFLAGYLQNTQDNIRGFGMVFEPVGVQPTDFYNLQQTFTATTTSMVPDPTYPILVTISTILLILALIIMYSKYSKKKKETQGTKWKKLEEQSSGPITQVLLQNCQVCGAKIQEQDIFCQNCGNRIK